MLRRMAGPRSSSPGLSVFVLHCWKKPVATTHSVAFHEATACCLSIQSIHRRGQTAQALCKEGSCEVTLDLQEANEVTRKHLTKEGAKDPQLFCHAMVATLAYDRD